MTNKFEEQFPELWKELQKETPVDKIKFNADWGNPRIIAARINVFKKMERLIQKHCVSKKFAVDIRTLNDIPLNQRPIPPDLKIRNIFGWTIADIAKMIQWYKENDYDGLIMEIGRLRETTISKSKVREAIEKLSYETSAYVNGNWMKVIRKDVLLKELKLEEK